MIQRLRKCIAWVVATFLLLITLGRVELNSTGRPTATDDSESTKPAATRAVDSDRES